MEITLRSLISTPLPPLIVAKSINSTERAPECPESSTQLESTDHWHDYHSLVQTHLQKSSNLLQRKILCQSPPADHSVESTLVSNVFYPVIHALGGLPSLNFVFPTEETWSVVLLDPDMAITFNRSSVLMVVLIPSCQMMTKVTSLSAGNSAGNDKDKRVVDTLTKRLFGLMLLNDCTFGLVTCYNKSWFAKRSSDRDLEISSVIGPQDTDEYSLVSGVFATLAESIEIEAAKKEQQLMTMTKRMGPQIWINPNQYVQFDISSAEKGGPTAATTIPSAKMNGRDVSIKISPAHSEVLDREHELYSELMGLQGHTIQQILATGNIWNLAKLIIYEKRDGRLMVEELTPEIHEYMLDLVVNMHQCDAVHKDLRLRDFVHCGSEELRVINLERAVIGSGISDKMLELERLEKLYTERNSDDYWILWD